MNIFDDATHQILMKFLDKKVKGAEDEIASTGTLSEDHAIPLLLKSQFNHIIHLDSELTEFRKSVDKRLENMDKRITRLFTGITVGFAIIGFLIILFGFLK